MVPPVAGCGPPDGGGGGRDCGGPASSSAGRDFVLDDLDAAESTAAVAHMERRGALVPPKMDMDDDPGGGKGDSDRETCSSVCRSPSKGKIEEGNGVCISEPAAAVGVVKSRMRGQV